MDFSKLIDPEHGKKDEDIKWGSAPAPETHKMVEFRELQLKSFTCEIAIRPSDNALVIHLKYLKPFLRHHVFFDEVTKYFRDNVGQFETLNSSYIGVLDSANKLYSLDLIFTQYFPALRGDMDWIERKVFALASDVDKDLIEKFGDTVVSTRKQTMSPDGMRG